MQPKGSQPGPSGSGVKGGAGEDALDAIGFDDDVAAPDVFEGPGSYQEKLLDADFFNAFPDDFDEADMEK